MGSKTVLLVPLNFLNSQQSEQRDKNCLWPTGYAIRMPDSTQLYYPIIIIAYIGICMGITWLAGKHRWSFCVCSLCVCACISLRIIGFAPMIVGVLLCGLFDVVPFQNNRVAAEMRSQLNHPLIHTETHHQTAV